MLAFAGIGCLHAKKVVRFCEEISCGAHADRHGFGEWNPKLPLHPAATGFGNFCIEADIEIGFWKPHDVGHRGLERHNSVDINAMTGEKSTDFDHIIATSESEERWTDQVDAGATPLVLPCLWVMAFAVDLLIFEESSYQLVQRFRCAPIFFFAVGRKLEAHDWKLEAHPARKGSRLILDQFCCAAFTHKQGVGLEAFNGFTDVALHQLCRVAA